MVPRWGWFKSIKRPLENLEGPKSVFFAVDYYMGIKIPRDATRCRTSGFCEYDF